MRYFFFPAILFSTLFLFIACNSSVDEKLQLAEHHITNAPDSSLYILQQIRDDYPEMTDDEKALFGLLFFQSLDKNSKDLSPAEMIDYSIDYYTRSNQKQRLAYSYLYKTHLFKNIRDYKNALENLFKARDYAIAGNDHSLLGKIYFDFAQISGYQEEYGKAQEYYELAEKEFEKARETENRAKTYMSMGWLYLALDDYDSSIKYSRKALNITTDSIIMGDVLNDIGNSYYFKEQFDSALYYIRQSLAYPYFDTNMSSRYYNIANVHSYLNKFDSAKYYVNQAFEYPIDIYFEEECYRVLTKIAIHENNKEDLQEYMAKHQACRDSIKLLEQQPNINILEHIHQTDKDVTVIKQQRLWMMIFIACLILIVSFIFLKLHKRNKQKQIKADIYRTELKNKHELLFRDLLNELEETKAKYAVERKKGTLEQREEIDKKIYNEVLHLDVEKSFINQMNKVLNNLPEKLKQDYPEMTYKEIVWCCLFVLEFPTSDISLILGFKQSTQYKFKQRLSKKLNFQNLKEFDQMLYDKMDIEILLS